GGVGETGSIRGRRGLGGDPPHPRLPARRLTGDRPRPGHRGQRRPGDRRRDPQGTARTGRRASSAVAGAAPFLTKVRAATRTPWSYPAIRTIRGVPAPGQRNRARVAARILGEARPAV